jgi:hypothetical protein
MEATSPGDTLWVDDDVNRCAVRSRATGKGSTPTPIAHSQRVGRHACGVWTARMQVSTRGGLRRQAPRMVPAARHGRAVTDGAGRKHEGCSGFQAALLSGAAGAQVVAEAATCTAHRALRTSTPVCSYTDTTTNLEATS